MRFQGALGDYTAPDISHREGGQARVYRARREGSGEEVAVKVARGAGRAAAWLGREADELARLHAEYPDLRPFVVRLVDRGEVVLADGQAHPFLVLEWMDGTLAEQMPGRPLAERLDALAAAAEALTRLHATARGPERGIAHQDIKPSNFLVATDPAGALRVVLSDFGGVRREALQSLSQGSLLGTIGFAPPDQLLRLRRVDTGWDVYALAVTIFWCLTVRADPETGQVEGQVPGANLVPTPPLTREGMRLYQLRLSGRGDSAEAEQLRELGAGSLRALVELDRIHPLTDEDARALQDALAAHLRGATPSADPEALAAALVEELLPELREALDPDPDRRGSSARRLQGACRLLADRTRRAAGRPPSPRPAPASGGSGGGSNLDIGRSVVIDSAPPPAPEPPPAPPPEKAPTRPRGGVLPWLAAAMGILGSLLLLLGGVVVLAIRFWPDPSAPVVEVLPMPGEVREVGGTPMAWIPGGSFAIHDPESGRQGEVRLSRGFWMMTTEVTQEQWLRVEGSLPENYHTGLPEEEGPRHPVEGVTWYEAVRFANGLSLQNALSPCYLVDGEEVSWQAGCSGFRLPTSAEWERAARAGGEDRYAGTSDPEAVCGYANVGDASSITGQLGLADGFSCNDGQPVMAPAGSFRANGWGLHDMTGNVSEWCWDRYGELPLNAVITPVDPVGPGQGAERVTRGGAWVSRQDSAQIAVRGRVPPGERQRGQGLRLVRSEAP